MSEKEMIPLPSHTYFEQLMGRGEEIEDTLPSFAIVYFTASWCKKCKTFDLDKIMAAAPNATWFLNDIDVNENTYAYCGLRSIPSFVVIKNKKYMGSLSKTTEEGVIKWVKEFV